MTASTATNAPRRRPKDRKNQIIHQARDLFVERGYPNVSMALIAERVGITAGALYRHFDNKSSLLEAVVAESFIYLDQPVTQPRLDAALDQAIDVLEDHPNLSELWARETLYLPEEARATLRRRMRVWAHAFIPPLHQQRSDLDAGQEELIAWGIQSALAFLGSSSSRTPALHRRPVVRCAALALADAELVPTGEPVPGAVRSLWPVSTREKLLIAAIDLFAETGYRETPMAAIGAAAHVTGPNLYTHFENKADLLRAVFERAIHSLWLNLDTALRTSQTSAEALEKLVVGHVQLAATWARVGSDVIGEPDIEESTRASQREYIAEWTALVREVCPDLELREARLRVLIAFSVINHLRRTPHISTFDTFPENVARLALAVLRANR
ncbi:MAG TPA: TetR/AcrR family transcriptional regulator [Nocardioidaceae bacterium]|nr:TetR/AcrR family transcriptional regulator [Nocardioidaceae bacterium]